MFLFLFFESGTGEGLQPGTRGASKPGHDAAQHTSPKGSRVEGLAKRPAILLSPRMRRATPRQCQQWIQGPNGAACQAQLRTLLKDVQSTGKHSLLPQPRCTISTNGTGTAKGCKQDNPHSLYLGSTSMVRKATQVKAMRLGEGGRFWGSEHAGSCTSTEGKRHNNARTIAAIHRRNPTYMSTSIHETWWAETPRLRRATVPPRRDTITGTRPAAATTNYTPALQPAIFSARSSCSRET